MIPSYRFNVTVFYIFILNKIGSFLTNTDEGQKRFVRYSLIATLSIIIIYFGILFILNPLAFLFATTITMTVITASFIYYTIILPN